MLMMKDKKGGFLTLCFVEAPKDHGMGRAGLLAGPMLNMSAARRGHPPPPPPPCLRGHKGKLGMGITDAVKG
jgi:hypothetical protein